MKMANSRIAFRQRQCDNFLNSPEQLVRRNISIFSPQVDKVRFRCEILRSKGSFCHRFDFFSSNLLYFPKFLFFSMLTIFFLRLQTLT